MKTLQSIEVDSPPSAPVATRTRRHKLRYTLLQAGVILAFLLVWELVSYFDLVDRFFISSPYVVGRKLVTWAADGTIFRHLVVTLREAISGWMIGSAAGIVVGFVLARVTALDRVFTPILYLLNTLPRVALAPLFIFWFGIGETSKVVLVVTIIIFIMIFNTYSGVKTINPELLQMTKLFGKSEWKTLKEVLFPWCVPWIFVGLRLGLGWSLSGAVVGEFIAARAGIGYLIFNAASNLDNSAVLAGCIVLLGMALVFFFLISAMEKRLLRWRPAHY